MTKINLQYDLANLTPADANPPEANFNRIEQHINQELVERDGTVGMRAELALSGDPVNALGAAPKQYVDNLLPLGVILPYGGVVAPVGTTWMVCNGAELETTLFPGLFAVLGTRFVTGVIVAGRFNVPDMRLRFPFGAQAGTTEVGARGGSADAVVVAHTHPVDHDHGSATSGTESVTHIHAGVDHLHGVNINSGFITADHSHSHNLGTILRDNPFSPEIQVRFGDGFTFGVDRFDANAAQTGGVSANHQHNVSGSTGAADRSLNTGTQSANHTHPVDLPAFTGASGAASGGVAGTGVNNPAYVGLTFIIRVL